MMCGRMGDRMENLSTDLIGCGVAWHASMAIPVMSRRVPVISIKVVFWFFMAWESRVKMENCPANRLTLRLQGLAVMRLCGRIFQEAYWLGSLPNSSLKALLKCDRFS